MRALLAPCLMPLFLVPLLLTPPAEAQESQYLYVWAADADREESDFVAVLDARRGSETYGRVLATVPVGLASGAHHTEHRMSAGGRLFANGFPSGTTFVVDLSDPLHGSVASRFTNAGIFAFPHSFERLPSGNVLATFQNGPGGEASTGGLVELDPLGRPQRSASAVSPGHPEIRPYSLAILPERDLVVTTTADMRKSPLLSSTEGLPSAVQLWRLSDLSLQRTLLLPPGPRGDEQFAPAEPRVLSDGRTVLVNTFRCGLYELRDLETDRPALRHVHTFQFEVGDREAGGVERRHCALPVVVGRYWIQTVPARRALVSLDLGDLSSPREVSAVELGDDFWPHWIAGEPGGGRIVATGPRTVVVRVDRETGALALDEEFADEGSFDFGVSTWPHGETGPAIPHGAVFSAH